MHLIVKGNLCYLVKSYWQKKDKEIQHSRSPRRQASTFLISLCLMQGHKNFLGLHFVSYEMELNFRGL